MFPSPSILSLSAHSLFPTEHTEFLAPEHTEFLAPEHTDFDSASTNSIDWWAAPEWFIRSPFNIVFEHLILNFSKNPTGYVKLLCSGTTHVFRQGLAGEDDIRQLVRYTPTRPLDMAENGLFGAAPPLTRDAARLLYIMYLFSSPRNIEPTFAGFIQWIQIHVNDYGTHVDVTPLQNCQGDVNDIQRIELSVLIPMETMGRRHTYSLHAFDYTGFMPSIYQITRMATERSLSDVQLMVQFARKMFPGDIAAQQRLLQGAFNAPIDSIEALPRHRCEAFTPAYGTPRSLGDSFCNYTRVVASLFDSRVTQQMLWIPENERVEFYEHVNTVVERFVETDAAASCADIMGPLKYEFVCVLSHLNPEHRRLFVEGITTFLPTCHTPRGREIHAVKFIYAELPYLFYNRRRLAEALDIVSKEGYFYPSYLFRIPPERSMRVARVVSSVLPNLPENQGLRNVLMRIINEQIVAHEEMTDSDLRAYGQDLVAINRAIHTTHSHGYQPHEKYGFASPHLYPLHKLPPDKRHELVQLFSHSQNDVHRHIYLAALLCSTYKKCPTYEEIAAAIPHVFAVLPDLLAPPPDMVLTYTYTLIGDLIRDLNHFHSPAQLYTLTRMTRDFFPNDTEEDIHTRCSFISLVCRDLRSFNSSNPTITMDEHLANFQNLATLARQFFPEPGTSSERLNLMKKLLELHEGMDLTVMESEGTLLWNLLPHRLTAGTAMWDSFATSETTTAPILAMTILERSATLNVMIAEWHINLIVNGDLAPLQEDEEVPEDDAYDVHRTAFALLNRMKDALSAVVQMFPTPAEAATFTNPDSLCDYLTQSVERSGLGRDEKTAAQRTVATLRRAEAGTEWPKMARYSTLAVRVLETDALFSPAQTKAQRFDMWLTGFLVESAEAYDGHGSMSCLGGIYERTILSFLGLDIYAFQPFCALGYIYKLGVPCLFRGEIGARRAEKIANQVHAGGHRTIELDDDNGYHTPSGQAYTQACDVVCDEALDQITTHRDAHFAETCVDGVTRDRVLRILQPIIDGFLVFLKQKFKTDFSAAEYTLLLEDEKDLFETVKSLVEKRVEKRPAKENAEKGDATLHRKRARKV